jgi:hypothetical protein
MSQTVLGSVTLGYEPLWNQNRAIVGFRIQAEALNRNDVDARHLLDALDTLWPDSAPLLLLSIRATHLLEDVLEHSTVQSPWIEVLERHISNPETAQKIQAASARGVRLIWRGEMGHGPALHAKGWFYKTLRSLTPQEALMALRVSLRQFQASPVGRASALVSPVVANQLYEGLASQALIEHALDQQSAWAVVGWPTEEVLYGYRFRQLQPAQHLLLAIIQSIEDDESLEQLEHRLGDEPLLTYRFLRFVNSAALGLGHTVTSVRHGLMVLGYAKLRTWLEEQVEQAGTDHNLEPIRLQMVIRGRIMEQITDAGIEDELRRELFLCGIFSQLDLVLGEALGRSLHRLPLPGRVTSAILAKTGPYAPWLEVATALESSSSRLIKNVCRAHKIPLDAVNRALLRTLAATICSPSIQAS